MDYIGFIYDKGLTSIEVDLNVWDYFDAQEKFRTFITDSDGKFIRIFSLGDIVGTVEDLLFYLNLDNSYLTPNKEQFQKFSYALITYSVKQTFNTILTNDDQGLAEESRIQKEMSDKWYEDREIGY